MERRYKLLAKYSVRNINGFNACPLDEKETCFIPITSTDTKMYAHVYVDGTAQTGIPVRFKIENSNDPTQSVETEAFTTVAGEWEILEFDFNNEATGTAALNTSYPFNMASIFFNFGSVGDDQTVYYFEWYH